MTPTRRCAGCLLHLPRDSWDSSRWRVGGRCNDCRAIEHRQTYVPKTGADDAPRCCKWCGVSYRPKQRKTSFFCGRDCKDFARNAGTVAARLAVKPTDRICLQCGDTMSASVRIDAKFCSVRCSDSAHSLQRKLRTRGGYRDEPGYVRVQIAERDKWQCGICQEPVDRRLRHPSPLSGSLDHVVPVSRGGTSDPENLRITHLVCNLRRGDGVGGEQLAIT